MTPTLVRTSLAVVSAAFAFAVGTPASAAPFTFTVTVEDNGTCPGGWTKTPSSDGTAAVLTCTTTAPTVGAPICSGITSSLSLPVAAGATPTLTLNGCTAVTPGALTYRWNQGSPNGTLVSASSSSNAWQVSPGPTTTTTYYATATVAAGTAAALSTSYSFAVTVQTNTPPPTTGLCSGYTAVDLGDIRFGTGTQDSFGLRNNIIAYGRIVIPDPLPSGWLGRTTSISVFEHGDGTAWKKIYLSKDRPCNFTNTGSNISQGLTASVYMNFGSFGFGAVTVKPGEVWYATIKNELPTGATSCASGSACNFGYLMPFPGF